MSPAGGPDPSELCFRYAVWADVLALSMRFERDDRATLARPLSSDRSTNGIGRHGAAYIRMSHATLPLLPQLSKNKISTFSTSFVLYRCATTLEAAPPPDAQPSTENIPLCSSLRCHDASPPKLMWVPSRPIPSPWRRPCFWRSFVLWCPSLLCTATRANKVEI